MATVPWVHTRSHSMDSKMTPAGDHGDQSSRVSAHRACRVHPDDESELRFPSRPEVRCRQSAVASLSARPLLQEAPGFIASGSPAQVCVLRRGRGWAVDYRGRLLTTTTYCNIRNVSAGRVQLVATSMSRCFGTGATRCVTQGCQMRPVFPHSNGALQ